MANMAAYFGVIPANVRYDKLLNAQEKLFYCEITTICASGAYCIVDYAYMAKLMDCSEATVKNYIDSLAKRGYIKTGEPREGKVRIDLVIGQQIR